MLHSEYTQIFTLLKFRPCQDAAAHGVRNMDLLRPLVRPLETLGTASARRVPDRALVRPLVRPLETPGLTHGMTIGGLQTRSRVPRTRSTCRIQHDRYVSGLRSIIRYHVTWCSRVPANLHPTYILTMALIERYKSFAEFSAFQLRRHKL